MSRYEPGPSLSASKLISPLITECIVLPVPHRPHTHTHTHVVHYLNPNNWCTKYCSTCQERLNAQQPKFTKINLIYKMCLGNDILITNGTCLFVRFFFQNFFETEQRHGKTRGFCLSCGTKKTQQSLQYGSATKQGQLV